MKYKIKENTIVLLILVLVVSGCSKLIEVDPPGNRITREGAFGSNETAISAGTGLLTSIGSGNSSTASEFLGLNFRMGLSGDELRLLPAQTEPSLLSLYLNSLTPSSPAVNSWNTLFSLIYRTNDIISGVDNNANISPLVKNQLIGEAKFLRALFYFYLVNLYGDVPLALTTDYTVNSTLPRADRESVYVQIIADLKEANTLLSENFLGGNLTSITLDRVRPTKWAATALLSRVYLYKKDYLNAEQLASSVIANTSKFELQSNDLAFLKNSKEAIWQLQPTASAAQNTLEGKIFVLPATGPSTNIANPFYLSSNLIKSFEPGDLRRDKWIGQRITSSGETYFYANKYKLGQNTTAGSEYSTILRISEQYLIRAEARVMQGGSFKISEGIRDLNLLRSRSRAIATQLIPNPLPDLPLMMSQDEAIQAIVHERQVELFTEIGHRWLDIKRLGLVDQIMQSAAVEKNIVWNNYQQLYPIPEREMLLNPSLKGRQNPGYQ